MSQTRLSDIYIFIAKSGSFRAVIEVTYTNPYTMARPVHNKENAPADVTGAAVSGAALPGVGRTTGISAVNMPVAGR